MYTIKNALLLKQTNHDMDITIFYMDIRTPAKGYEEFYNRARAMGIRFIQGRPSQITEDPDHAQPVSSRPRIRRWAR